MSSIAPTGGEIARDPDAARGALRDACLASVRDGAEVVILGGAALAGLAGSLAGSVPVPLVCSFEAGLRTALTCGELGLAKAREGSYAQLRLRSGEIRKVHIDCRATIGEVGNAEHNLESIGKAGRKRWRGVRDSGCVRR